MSGRGGKSDRNLWRHLTVGLKCLFFFLEEKKNSLAYADQLRKYPIAVNLTFLKVMPTRRGENKVVQDVKFDRFAFLKAKIQTLLH